MEYKEFVVDYFNSLSAERKNAVMSVFMSASAGIRIYMKPVSVIAMPVIDYQCRGEDEGLYLNCLIDSLAIEKALHDGKQAGEIVPYCSENSLKVIARHHYKGVSASAEKVCDYFGYSDGVTEDDLVGSKGERVVDPEEEDNWDADEAMREMGMGGSQGSTEDEEEEDTTEKVEEPTDNDEEYEEEPEKSLDDIDREIDSWYGNTLSDVKTVILKKYDLLFSSGYDLMSPYGVMFRDGAHYTDSTCRDVLRPRTELDGSTSLELYDFFQSKLGFCEMSCRSMTDVCIAIVKNFVAGDTTPLYFPKKFLEMAYGRVISVRSESQNGGELISYSYAKGRNSWSEYKAKNVEKYLERVLRQCVREYVRALGTKDLSSKEVRSTVRNLLNYASVCLSVGFLVVDYKKSGGSPVKIKLRVCDPSGRLSNADYMPSIINEVFSGNNGGDRSKSMKSGLDPVLSAEARVFEYAHEFDHEASNALPLFAYKALKAIKARGETPSWENAVIGQAMDDTILKNGSVKVNLEGSLFHHVNAGSRAGKGVMTLNFLACGIASNKALFYIDNKPDMGSMLAKLAHAGGNNVGSVNGPDMFVLNGSNIEDDAYGEFQNCDNWIIPENIPAEARELFGDPYWKNMYGDLFYMRAIQLCLGIVLARGYIGKNLDENPNLGGKNGVMMVFDEVNILQNRLKGIMQKISDAVPPKPLEYKNAIFAIKSAVGSAKEGVTDKKVHDAVSKFRNAFSSTGFYALALLKSYSDSISYLLSKSRSGYVDKATASADIFVIGQDLEEIPIGEDIISGAIKMSRYKSLDACGLYSTAEGNAVRGKMSIPYRMFLFRKTDAFIGYNLPHQSYLMQGDSRSNAFGVLDEKARGFAYVPTFGLKEGERPAGQIESFGMSNDNATVYFRPYLILNDCAMDSSYVLNMFKYAKDAGSSEEQVMSEYADAGNPKVLDRGVGFEGYMELMGLGNDLASRLSKGAKIADYVVRKMGYTGVSGSSLPLWLQFCTDMRVKWIFSVKDVTEILADFAMNSNILGATNALTEEYDRYVKDIIELKSMGVDIGDEALAYTSEDGSFNESDKERIEREIACGASDDGYDFDEEDRQECHRGAAAMGDYDDDGTDEYDMEDYEDGMGAYEGNYQTNKAGSYTEDGAEDHGESGKRGMRSEDSSRVDEKLEEYEKNGYPENGEDFGSFTVDRNGRINTDFTASEERCDMSDIFEGASMEDLEDAEKQSDAYASLVVAVTKRVLRDFGGVERICSFRVVGGSLVINNTMYRCKLKPECTKHLYLDLRREVNAGNIAKLFDYRALDDMPNLRDLRFDSREFVDDFVSVVLFEKNGADYKDFFSRFGSLDTLWLGGQGGAITREKAQAMSSSDALEGSRFYGYADACNNVVTNINKSLWNSTKNLAGSKKHGLVVKTFGCAFLGAASLVTGLTRLGTNAVKGVSGKVVKGNAERELEPEKPKKGGFMSGIKKGFKAAKDSVSGLFDD